ncbi:hypothetical protein JCM9140_1542 [Halalkalibacter wakoensis JCM 9140]|uniref:Uncharacterized protein n=1 Tax=Halalkalibacter wakoensis JCM 9140 TaxID=1236970 RepID=W4Q0N7_9BACI|nr:hypothetical protein [Halalkalibacter wakoensis]GAE25542.1 hypothetical protein JCM9140_1542 [Halalkalibacter wakoensis JCM 9140]
MRCNSKCFLVEMEQNGERQTKTVTARSSIEARKTIRGQYGAATVIQSVVEKR